MNEATTISKIEKMIYVIRGQRVMLDSDLAELYGVETKVLNQTVKRNCSRFPDDFMFQITRGEGEILRSQFVTFKSSVGSRKYLPYVFSENGVAMLSTVLNTERAIQINITIMRIFTKLRSFLVMEDSFEHRLSNLEVGTNKLFKVVFERLDSLEEDSSVIKVDRKKIGFKRE